MVSLGVAAVLAAATIVAGSATSRTAGASTTACGESCSSPSVESLGTGQVLTVSGTSVEMATASSSNSGQDWTPEEEGDVANAVSAGVLSAKLNMLYSTDTLVEFQYAPDGVPSDDCLATGTKSVTFDVSTTSTTGANSTTAYTVNVPTDSVILTACGLSAQSLWILDGNNETDGYVDLISAGYATQTTFADAAQPGNFGYESYFAEPAVLTVSSSGNVELAPLSEIGGVVSAGQMWADWSAPAQAALRARVERSR
jgi:hypothetical protein